MSDSLKMVDIVEVAPGLKRGWLFDRHVVVFAVDNTQRTTVDAWFDLVSQTVADWQDGQPYLEIHDMRKVSITPYNRQRAQQLVKQIGDIHGRSAILVSDTVLGKAMAFFANAMRGYEKNLQHRAFTDVEKAQGWIAELLSDATSPE